MEQPATNDNGPPAAWSLRGPDADFNLWLDYQEPGCEQSFNLGDAGQVQLAFNDYLCTVDYGTLAAEELPKVAFEISVQGVAPCCAGSAEVRPRQWTSGRGISCATGSSAS